MISDKDFVQQVDSLFKAAILSSIPPNRINHVFFAFSDLASNMTEMYEELDGGQKPEANTMLPPVPTEYSLASNNTIFEQTAKKLTEEEKQRREKENEYQRNWYKKNKARIRIQKREYYHKKRDEQ